MKSLTENFYRFRNNPFIPLYHISFYFIFNPIKNKKNRSSFQFILLLNWNFWFVVRYSLLFLSEKNTFELGVDVICFTFFDQNERDRKDQSNVKVATKDRDVHENILDRLLHLGQLLQKDTYTYLHFFYFMHDTVKGRLSI